MLTENQNYRPLRLRILYIMKTLDIGLYKQIGQSHPEVWFYPPHAKAFTMPKTTIYSRLHSPKRKVNTGSRLKQWTKKLITLIYCIFQNRFYLIASIIL